jgi:nicotinate-nucleotide adenylyltransferase
MFDPVHLGHLRAAVEVRALLGAETVALVPAGRPVHRPPPQAPGALRRRLLEVACAEGEGLVCDPRELEREGPSDTATTLAEVRRAIGPDAPLVWVLGHDAFLGLPRWHEATRLSSLAHFLVLNRGGRRDVPADLRSWLAGAGFRRARTPAFLRREPAGRFFLFAPTPYGVSSSQIRRLRASGGDIRYLVPAAVREVLDATDCYTA